MLAFAGLLVALRVGQDVTVTTGSCPLGNHLSATESLCFHDMLPSPMTQEFLCSAATEDFRCCWTTEGGSLVTSICHQTAADSMYADYLQCGETIYDVEMGGNTFWSVRCPWPPPSRSTPAEPAEDLDGATVGTIVVASLIGVALVGGAIAVHLEV